MICQRKSLFNFVRTKCYEDEVIGNIKILNISLILFPMLQNQFNSIGRIKFAKKIFIAQRVFVTVFPIKMVTFRNLVAFYF